MNRSDHLASMFSLDGQVAVVTGGTGVLGGTTATGIPKERYLRVNLGYLDPGTIDMNDSLGREREGLAVIRNAGETLYRAQDVS